MGGLPLIKWGRGMTGVNTCLSKVRNPCAPPSLDTSGASQRAPKGPRCSCDDKRRSLLRKREEA